MKGIRQWLPKAAGEAGLLLILTVIAAAGTKAFHPLAPAWYVQPNLEPYALTLSLLQERWEDPSGIIWIDARTEAAYAAGHYPGAIRLTMEEWNTLLYDHFDTLTAAAGPKVVYCDGSKCAKSKEVATALRDLGLSEVYHLHGGWDALLETLPPSP